MVPADKLIFKDLDDDQLQAKIEELFSTDESTWGELAKNATTDRERVLIDMLARRTQYLNRTLDGCLFLEEELRSSGEEDFANSLKEIRELDVLISLVAI